MSSRFVAEEGDFRITKKTRNGSGDTMPVKACTVDGKPGYKYGDSGKCYTYEPGNEASKGKAKQKAYIQGAAIEANSPTENAFCPTGPGGGQDNSCSSKSSSGDSPRSLSNEADKLSRRARSYEGPLNRSPDGIPVQKKALEAHEKAKLAHLEAKDALSPSSAKYYTHAKRVHYHQERIEHHEDELRILQKAFKINAVPAPGGPTMKPPLLPEKLSHYEKSEPQEQDDEETLQDFFSVAQKE